MNQLLNPKAMLRRTFATVDCFPTAAWHRRSLNPCVLFATEVFTVQTNRFVLGFFFFSIVLSLSRSVRTNSSCHPTRRNCLFELQKKINKKKNIVWWLVFLAWLTVLADKVYSQSANPCFCFFVFLHKLFVFFSQGYFRNSRPIISVGLSLILVCLLTNNDHSHMCGSTVGEWTYLSSAISVSAQNTRPYDGERSAV